MLRPDIAKDFKSCARIHCVLAFNSASARASSLIAALSTSAVASVLASECAQDAAAWLWIAAWICSSVTARRLFVWASILGPLSCKLAPCLCALRRFANPLSEFSVQSLQRLFWRRNEVAQLWPRHS